MLRTIEEIETDVARLTPSELASFRAWFDEFDAQSWDRQFAADVAAGRLEGLATEALRDLREGRTTAR